MANERIIDYISNIEIIATPEELEAVQPYSKTLVNDYKYDKEFITTRPQFRVKTSPSDQNGKPIDIGIFKTKNKLKDDLYIIVECKKKNRKDGLEQLKIYLTYSTAKFGVWFNGNEIVYLQKVLINNEINFEQILDIPKFNEKLENIGKYKKKDLISPKNLLVNFNLIRNYLAANSVGITRDEQIAQQIIYMIFIKLYDEKETSEKDFLKFSFSINDDEDKFNLKIYLMFEDLKKQHIEIFDETDNLKLDINSLKFVVSELQKYSFIHSERDVLSSAFELFVGNQHKGEQGQFFTPKNIVKNLVRSFNIETNAKVLDPSSGSGTFLLETLKYVWEIIDIKAKNNGWTIRDIEKEKNKVASNLVFGIDKDDFLAKISKAYMVIMGDGKSNIFCSNSLDFENWNSLIKEKIKFNSFDFIFTNPPYGKELKIKDKEILNKYSIWKNFLGEPKETQPQYLFIELYQKLLKENGIAAIVLPDSVLGNKDSLKIRNFISNHFQILGLIGLPKETFMPYTTTKTTILVLQKNNNPNMDQKVFISKINNCGYNRRGEPIEGEDFTFIFNKFKTWLEKK